MSKTISGQRLEVRVLRDMYLDFRRQYIQAKSKLKRMGIGKHEQATVYVVKEHTVASHRRSSHIAVRVTGKAVQSGGI